MIAWTSCCDDEVIILSRTVCLGGSTFACGYLYLPSLSTGTLLIAKMIRLGPFVLTNTVLYVRQLPLLQGNVHESVYDMMVGLDSIRTAAATNVPQDPLDGTAAPQPDGGNEQDGDGGGAGAEDGAGAAGGANKAAAAKKRKLAGKSGGTSLFPTRYLLGHL
jgi:hypothetical protein